MITRESLLSLEDYHKQRNDLRKAAMHRKNIRRVHLGEHVTLMFEDEVTLRYQIQEMLRIEKTFDEEGIQDELDAYNPLLPNGRNWKCTMMIEYPDSDERHARLQELKGIEDRTYVQVQGHDRVYAIADEDLERTNDSKTSAVHFMRFELTDVMAEAIKQGSAIAMGIDHAQYNHRVDEIAPETQGALADDLA